MHRRKMLFHHPSYRTGRDRKFDINRKIPLIGKNCLFGLFRQFSQLSSALQPMGIGSKTWTAPTPETHHGSPAWGDGWLAMAADSLRLGPSGIAPRGAAVALDCILVGEKAWVIVVTFLTPYLGLFIDTTAPRRGRSAQRSGTCQISLASDNWGYAGWRGHRVLAGCFGSRPCG